MSVKQLLRIAGQALAPVVPAPLVSAGLGNDALLREVHGLLSLRNGFYAFECALHVFPLNSSGSEIGLSDWNSDGLWRLEYGDLVGGCLFFAEDVFGGQFCLKNGSVAYFDPETGGTETVGAGVDEWARSVCQDYELRTGFPLAHEWQAKNGPLLPGKRLLPKTPFVCGGSFTLDNLYAGDAVKGMQVRGDLARQLRTLPEGAQITFRIVE